MTTLLATLGFRPAAILPTVRACSVNRAYIFHYAEDDVGKSERAVKATLKALRAVEVEVDAVELGDGYDYAACLDEILRQAKRAQQATPPGEDIVFDVTGGTKPMAFAAFSVAWILGKRVVYNIETRPEAPTVHIPIEGLQDHATLGQQTEKVLRIILGGDEGSAKAPGVTPEHLRAKFGAKSDSAINFHIDKLERMRAIERTYGATLKDVRYVATPAARVLAIALDARREAGSKLAPPQDRRKRRR